MSLHAQHSIKSAFCMYGSELLGGLQPPEPPPLDPPLISHPLCCVRSHYTLLGQDTVWTG